MTRQVNLSYLGYVLMRSGQSAAMLRVAIGPQAEALEAKYQADMSEAEALRREREEWEQDQAAIADYEIWHAAFEMLASDAEWQGASES